MQEYLHGAGVPVTMIRARIATLVCCNLSCTDMVINNVVREAPENFHFSVNAVSFV